MSSVETYMTKNFQRLSGALEPWEAIAQLQNDYYGIVEDEKQNPVAVVVAEDLEQAAVQNAPSLLATRSSFRPTMMVGGGVDMEELVKSTLIDTLVQEARVALVVDGEEQVVGILTTEAVIEYLRSGGGSRSVRGGAITALGDSGLAGSLMPLTIQRICYQCWFVNTFTDAENLTQMPSCQNLDQPPHPFKLKRT